MKLLTQHQDQKYRIVINVMFSLFGKILVVEKLTKKNTHNSEQNACQMFFLFALGFLLLQSHDREESNTPAETFIEENVLSITT